MAAPASLRAPSDSTPGHAERDTYADVGLAQRYSRARLEAAHPSTLQRRVWEVVAADFLGSWSRLTDVRPHLIRDVCRCLGLDPDARGSRSKVGAVLGWLRAAGALDYRPGDGSDPAMIGLPVPPDEWVDPTCGRTAGQLRDRRHSHAQDTRSEAGGGSPTGWVRGGSPNRWVTRYEDVYEDDSPPTPPCPATPGGGVIEGIASETETVVSEAVDLLARAELAGQPPGRVRHPEGWLAVKTRTLRADRHDELAALATAHQPATGADLLDLLDRAAHRQRQLDAAASLGRSRARIADLTDVEVADEARRRWPDSPDLVDAAMTAWAVTRAQQAGPDPALLGGTSSALRPARSARFASLRDALRAGWTARPVGLGTPGREGRGNGGEKPTLPRADCWPGDSRESAWHSPPSSPPPADS